MTGFHYEDLKSSRAIRLLKFLPGPKPVCQMITVEVEKAPPFLALSYTWGCKDYTREIQVDGSNMPIATNLGDAIDAMFVFAKQRGLLFWADSICINQKNFEERSHQVRLMNSIYRSAENVAIWLGKAADDSDHAFDAMERWKAKFDMLLKQSGDSWTTVLTSIPVNDPYFFGRDGSKERTDFEAIAKLRRRQWWSRAWIVQEGTVGDHSRTIVFCGGCSTRWMNLRAALWITHYVSRVTRSNMDADLNDMRAIYLDEFRWQRERGVNIQLLRVLRLMRRYECEDPRDKVYAALGMAMDTNENDIIPDYRKTTSEVYMDVVRVFTSKSDMHSLDFLGDVVRLAPGAAWGQVENSSLPSWVPDWTLRSSTTPLPKALDLDTYREIPCAYHASRNLTGNCYIDGQSLRAQGLVLDEINNISSICNMDLAMGGIGIEQSWAPTNTDTLYFNGQTVMEAYVHAVVADSGRVNMLDGTKLSRDYAIDWELVKYDSASLNAAERERQSVMLTDIKERTLGRRLFYTSRGFMGLGPAAAQLGDQVCVLLGGQMLYVLRSRDDDCFEFVGECYVHGMMDGEACEDGTVFREIVLV